mmetsp:Transcript_10656/g.43091  ORF Transcript_10656/g.43091 Transcript_10656/m.43091 type:complete len:217 (-) Transcript_10656:384-1034(-)
MARTASARSFPTESCLIFRVRSRKLGGSSIEFATMSSSTADASMSSAALPEKSACVAKAKTRCAPWSLRWFAAEHSVRPESIMSSTMMQSQSRTSPTSVSESPASPIEMHTASEGVSSDSDRRPSAKSLARATPAASGETTAGRTRSLAWKYETAAGAAYKLSTGHDGAKKPWICAQCKSTESTRSTPMASIIVATSAPAMGTRMRRGWCDCREYG